MKKQLLFIFGSMLLSTMSYAQYCASNATSTGDSKISQVTLAGNSTTIQTPLSPSGNGIGQTYTDFTALPAAELSLGLTYNLDILTGTTGVTQYAKYTEAYIDWNNDGVLSDPAELLGFTSTAYGVIPTVLTISFTVPATATPGTTRLRIVCRESGSAATTQPCGTYTWGETEDFSVLILPPGLTAITPDTLALNCFGDMDAAINSIVVGGTSPYTYAWSTGSTASSVSGLGAGSYSLTVTDANGDMDTAYTEVVQPDSIVVNAAVITDLICDYDISEVTAVGTGGVALTGYSIDTNSALFNPDTSMTGTVVSIPGNYASSIALPIGFDFVFFGDTVSSFKCNSEGFITFESAWNSGWTADHAIPSVNGPSGVIAFGWENFAPLNGGEVNYYTMGTAPFRTLVVNYDEMPYEFGTPAVDFMTVQIQLHETSNCIEIHSTTVGNSIQAGNAVQGIENLAENEAYFLPGRNYQVWSATNDYIRFCPIDASGLQYSWSSGDFGSPVFGLSAGTYTVTATDANGCEATDDVTVALGISNFVSALDAEDVSCFGFDDASIDPGISGGVNPISYSWSNGATSATLSNLSPGTYSVSAEDAVGCTIEVNNVTVMEPAILLGSIYDLENAICSNDENGSASIVVSGGVPPYTPLWSNGEIAYTATQLPAGSNYVQITDANGCQAVLTVNTLFDFQSPTPDIGNNFINPTGGGVTLNTLPSTYSSYLWSTGATTSSISAELTGFYWVEVTNDAGCTGSDTAYVEIWPTGVSEVKELVGVAMYPNPAIDMINFNISADINQLNVAIVDVKGATVAQTQFNNAGVQSISLENLSAGIYSVQLSTEDGQVSTQKLVVTK